jgi:hypothetical protein
MKNGEYILVVAPDDYPGKRYRNRYVYEHQLVWWQNSGQLVPVDYLIHHINENKTDNRIENLELKSRSKHSAEHQKPAPLKLLVCEFCAKEFTIDERNFRFKTKIKQERFYCSRSCGVRNSHRLRKQQNICL